MTRRVVEQGDRSVEVSLPRHDEAEARPNAGSELGLAQPVGDGKSFVQRLERCVEVPEVALGLTNDPQEACTLDVIPRAGGELRSRDVGGRGGIAVDEANEPRDDR